MTEWLKWKGYGYHEQDLKRRFGLQESDVKRMPPHLRRDFREIDGVRVMILSSEDARAFWNRTSGSPHRVIAECPKCERLMSAGRLHQHLGFSSIGRGRRAPDCLPTLMRGMTTEEVAARLPSDVTRRPQR